MFLFSEVRITGLNSETHHSENKSRSLRALRSRGLGPARGSSPIPPHGRQGPRATHEGGCDGDTEHMAAFIHSLSGYSRSIHYVPALVLHSAKAVTEASSLEPANQEFTSASSDQHPATNLLTSRNFSGGYPQHSHPVVSPGVFFNTAAVVYLGFDVLSP